MFTGNQDIIIGTGNDDAVMEQLPPRNTFGKQHIMLPLPEQNSYAYSIVSATPNNVVRDGVTSLATLNAGQSFPANFVVSDLT